MYTPAPQATRRPPHVHLRGGLYVTLYIVFSIATSITVALASQPHTTEVAAAIPIPLLGLVITQAVFVYKMYKALDDGATRPTPGAAVGFYFIPIFGLIWHFIVWGKFAGQYNRLLQRHHLRLPPLGTGLYVAALVLGFVPVVGLVLWAVVLGRTARAVNALYT